MTSTHHALPKIVRSKRKTFKIFWILLTLASTSGCIYFETNIIRDYLQFNVITSTKIYHEVPMRFPMVTICGEASLQLPQKGNYFSMNCTFNNQICERKYYSIVDENNNHTCLRINGHSNDSMFSVNDGLAYGLNLELNFDRQNRTALKVPRSLEVFVHNNSLGNMKINYIYFKIFC